MCVTWDDLENTEFEEGIVCFMAIKDNDDGGSDNRVNKSNLSYDKLFCAFEEIHEDIQRLLEKINSLKNEFYILSKQNEALTAEMIY